MRIVIVNMHANEFWVKTASKYLYKQSCAFKHKYFRDYLIDNPDVELCSYVNKDGFTLVHSLPQSIMWFLRKFRFMEHRWVMRKNGISSKQVKLIRSRKDIRPDDIVIGYRHVPCSLTDMAQIKAFRVISMIHFHGQQADSDLIKAANPHILMNECDLGKHSEIFKKYYSWYKGDFLLHPFVAAERFQSIKPYAERENRCFSTGTITYKEHSEFLEVYGDSCDQPTRKQILVNKKALEPLVACYNSDYLEDNEMKAYLPSDNIFKHYYKVYYNSTHVGQKKYFSFNMVEKMNDFKMCLVGEEILGIPGIGFVEGMSCGCAYIGQTDGYYEDYGMQEGVHYIGYDGSLNDLKAKITYYQQPEHQEELESIAHAGLEFAKAHFNGTAAAKFLLEKLVEEQKKHKTL